MASKLSHAVLEDNEYINVVLGLCLVRIDCAQSWHKIRMMNKLCKEYFRQVEASLVAEQIFS